MSLLPRRLRRTPTTTAPSQATPTDRADRLAALAAADGSEMQVLLREVAEFRLALETDLVIAAAAVEADAHGIAHEVVDGAAAATQLTSEALLDHLVADARATRPQRRSSDRAPRRAAPVRRPLLLVTGVTAVLGVVGGVAVGMQLSAGPPARTVIDATAVSDRADRSLDRLAQIAQDSDGASSQQWVQTTSDLHSDINALISAAAGGDVDAAASARSLLSRETALLDTVPGLMSAQLRAQINLLSASLNQLVPPVVDLPTVLPSVVPVLPQPSATPRSSATPSPTAAPTTAPPSPAASTTSPPAPAASPSSSTASGPGATSSADPGGGVGFPGTVGNGRPAL